MREINMGSLNLEVEPRIRSYIRDVLRRRGIKPIVDGNWEVHGPHLPNMNYQVFVDDACELDNEEEVTCVAIYPRAVYALWNFSDWQKPNPDNRIYCNRR